MSCVPTHTPTSHGPPHGVTTTVAHRRGRRGWGCEESTTRPKGERSDPQGRGKNRRASVGGPLGRQKSPAQRMQPLLASHKPRAHEDASLGRLGETQRGSEDKGLSQTLGPKVRGGISIKEGDDKGDIERGDFLMPLASISSATEWFRVTTKHEGNFISRGQGEPRVAGIIEEISHTL